MHPPGARSASSGACNAFTHASKLTQTISLHALTPFATTGQVSPALPCLLHVGNVANTYVADMDSVLPTMHSPFPCTLRAATTHVWVLGTSLLRKQPPNSKKWDLGRIFLSFLAPQGENSEALPHSHSGFQSSGTEPPLPTAVVCSLPLSTVVSVSSLVSFPCWCFLEPLLK